MLVSPFVKDYNIACSGPSGSRWIASRSLSRVLSGLLLTLIVLQLEDILTRKRQCISTYCRILRLGRCRFRCEEEEKGRGAVNVPCLTSTGSSTATLALLCTQHCRRPQSRLFSGACSSKSPLNQTCKLTGLGRCPGNTDMPMHRRDAARHRNQHAIWCH